MKHLHALIPLHFTITSKKQQPFSKITFFHPDCRLPYAIQAFGFKFGGDKKIRQSIDCLIFGASVLNGLD